MANKIRATLLMCFVLCSTFACLHAQDSYEYATLRHDYLGPTKYKISFSTDDNVFKEIVEEYPDKKYAYSWNAAPALKWIKDNGWEIVEYHPSISGKTSNDFLLRKKR